MKKECRDHLTSIVVTFLLKYGTHFRDHVEEMGEYWDGPLDDECIFFNQFIVNNYTKLRLAKILSQMKNFEIHPLYNRDFFEGIVDGLGRKTYGAINKRIQFNGRIELKEFLESNEHGFNIEFGDNNKDPKNRTKALPFLKLPLKGEMDRYLAGVISSGRVIENENGEPLCAVEDTCEKRLRKFGIIYERQDRFITLSPFYVFLFCGDLPEQIFSMWDRVASNLPLRKTRRAAIESLLHWRKINGTKLPCVGLYPFLLERTMYYHVHGMTIGDLEGFMNEKRFDFIDKRIRQRCKRWYNIHDGMRGSTKNSKDQ